MPDKKDLRQQRTNTVINKTSLRQEKVLQRAVNRIKEVLEELHLYAHFSLDDKWYLKDIAGRLRKDSPAGFIIFLNTVKKTLFSTQAKHE